MTRSNAKTVVLVTGGTSGLGLHACLHIAKQPNYHLLLTGRNADRVHAAAEQVRAVAAATTTVEEGVLDLASLASVRAYATQLLTRSDVGEIATLLCNGGIHPTQKAMTADGFESTFGVNHLGHFYLATLLRKCLGRIVMISSETHDPAEKTPAPPPNVSDLEQLALGYEPFNGGEAYATSKLCNLLFMFEWLRRFPNGADCIAYTPGFTPDTQLLRDMNADLDAVISMCKANGVPVSTSAISGTFMGRLCVEDWAANGWASGQYIRVDTVYEPSAQAKDAALATALWTKSSELVDRVVAKQ